MGNCCVRKEKIKLIDYGQCRACYKVFQKPNERTEHYSPVFITPYLRCSRCNHVFTSKCDEATHKNKVHGKQIYQERVQRAKFADEQRRQTMYEKYRKEREKDEDRKKSSETCSSSIKEDEQLLEGQSVYNCTPPLYRKAPDGTTQGMRHQYMVNHGIMAQ